MSVEFCTAQLRSLKAILTLQAFVEMNELTKNGEQMEWKETARWIKFEENVEDSNRWGKPHVASLTFHSLLDLKKGLEKGSKMFYVTTVIFLLTGTLERQPMWSLLLSLFLGLLVSPFWLKTFFVLSSSLRRTLPI